MKKPTDEEIQKAIDVLVWIIEDTKENEPFAKNSIAAMESCVECMPTCQEELSGG